MLADLVSGESSLPGLLYPYMVEGRERACALFSPLYFIFYFFV